jgi:ribulose kinase
MLTRSVLSHRRATVVKNKAISENQRKLAAPYCRRFTGITMQTKAVTAIFNQKGITSEELRIVGAI